MKLKLTINIYSHPSILLVRVLKIDISFLFEVVADLISEITTEVKDFTVHCRFEEGLMAEKNVIKGQLRYDVNEMRNYGKRYKYQSRKLIFD